MTVVVPGIDAAGTRRGLKPPVVGEVAFDRGRTLVAAKLSAPKLRPGTVERSRLLKILRRSSSQSIVSVIAPPGYGKTTVLAQWAAAARSEGRSVGWLRLDELDNDPELLVAYVSAAFDRIVPRDARDVPSAARPPRSGVAREAALLAARLQDASGPALLILDDVHRLTSRAALGVVERIIERLPAGTRVALAGRVEPDLPLARYRADRLLLELSLDALALDEPEAAAL